MDWKSVFSLDIPLLEIILRGSVMYIALFILLRVVLKTQAGGLGMTDLLLITLIADASQNAMAGEYRSLPAGIILVGTILFWSYALDRIGSKLPWFGCLLEPHPLHLIRDGKLLRRNMRRELITEEELKSQLRLQGLEDFKQVRTAQMESDGQISIIAYELRAKAEKKGCESTTVDAMWIRRAFDSGF